MDTVSSLKSHPPLIEFEWGLTYDDYAHFTQFHNRSKFLQKAAFYTFVSLVVLNFLVFRSFNLAQYWSLSGLWVGVLALALGVLSWSLFWVFLRFNTKKGFQKGRLGQEKWHFAFYSDGLEMKGDTPFRMLWGELHGVRETPKAWFLYVDPKRAYILPRSALNLQQLEIWSQLVRQKVKPPRFQVLF